MHPLTIYECLFPLQWQPPRAGYNTPQRSTQPSEFRNLFQLVTTKTSEADLPGLKLAWYEESAIYKHSKCSVPTFRKLPA